MPLEDNDRAITPSIRVKEQPKSFDEKVAQKVGAECYAVKGVGGQFTKGE